MEVFVASRCEGGKRQDVTEGVRRRRESRKVELDIPSDQHGGAWFTNPLFAIPVPSLRDSDVASVRTWVGIRLQRD